MTQAARTPHAGPRVKKERTSFDIRNSNLKRNYGITILEYNQLLADQDYRCAVCKRHEEDLPAPRGGRPRKDGTPAATAQKLVVDHCHAGGSVRALLCQGCNVGIGAFDEDPARMIAAAEWLMAIKRS